MNKFVRWLSATLLLTGLLVGIGQVPARAVILNAVTLNDNGSWTTSTDWDCDTDTAGNQNCVPNSGHNVVINNTGFAISGTQTVNKMTINAGKELVFAAGTNTALGSRGNIVVKGTLTMHPNSNRVHTIRFTGITEANFTGGGDYGDCSGCTANPPAADVGIWVLNDGKLDAQGTDKVPWCRCDGDASWGANDELVATPIQFGEGVQDESLFPEFDPSTQDPDTVTFGEGEAWETTYTQEILNLTRNVNIEGEDIDERAHIYILSRTPQNIKRVAIRYMGPRKDGDAVLGRYALHFHKNMHEQDGVVVEDVVVRDSGSHAFAVHMSDGVTLEGTISYNTFEDAYWWDGPTDFAYPDPPSPTTDGITINNAVAALVRSDPVYEGVRLTGFNLGAGLDNTITNSVAVGVQGTVDSGGFLWPENVSVWGDDNSGVDCDPSDAGTQGCNNQFGVWVFDGNLAHNNSGSGAVVWQVNSNDHVITDFDAYHNGMNGVYNGAYGNPYKWDNLKLFSNGGANSEEPLGPHTQFFAFMGSLDVKGSPNSETVWNLTNSVLDAGGLTDSAIVLAGRGIIDVTGSGASQPGDFLGNTLTGYNEQGVWFSFSFHDLGGLGHDGYELHWFFDDANVFDGTGPDFEFDSANLPGESFPSIHEDSSIEVEGVGELFRYDHSGGTLDTACNCKVVT